MKFTSIIWWEENSCYKQNLLEVEGLFYDNLINFEILACSYFYILLLATYIFWIRNKQKQRIRPHSQKCLVQVTRLTHHSKWKKSGFAYGGRVVGIFTAWSTILNPHWYMPNFFFDGSQSYIPDLGNKMGKIPLW